MYRRGWLPALAALVVASCAERAPAAGDPDPASAAAPGPTTQAAILEASAPVVTTPPPPIKPAPFGTARTSPKTLCGAIGGKHVAERDLRTSFVDGTDLLALVNRSPTGGIAPDWAPADLVDLRTNKPATVGDCEKALCLRQDTAGALGELLGEMKKAGFPGKVESAFRSYATQCGTFLKWANKSDFCSATEQSAIPGHSQHQLGTTVDLFTEEWAKDERGVFREGFGCTPAGKFLQDHAWDFGFVMPYPIHPDDRHPKQSCVTRWDIPININPKTGYRYEHWHIRYVGKDAALRFKAAWEKSRPGTPSELTVEQWLRAEKGLSTASDAELPVCDGCNCGACSTLADPGDNACDKRGGALHLDAFGKAVASESTPSFVHAKAGRGKKGRGPLLEVKVASPPGLLTQPPILSDIGASYASPGATFEKLVPYPDTEPRGFPAQPGAWVVAVEPVPNPTATAWPYRAAITVPIHARIYNKANVVFPAHEGATVVKVWLPEGVTRAKVAFLRDGVARDERTVELSH